MENTSERVYRVLLDEDWDLEDLYDFPHAYSQAYTYVYFFDNSQELEESQLIDYCLESYPWNGGYSYVNIYKTLKRHTPKQDKPKVHSIQYASPGWLDLTLNYEIALKVAASVTTLLSSSVGAVTAYRQIKKTLSAINTDRKENEYRMAELTKNEANELMRLSDDLSRHIGFESFAALNRRTKDLEVSAKLLTAHYRRLNILAEFVKKGKVSMPLENKNK